MSRWKDEFKNHAFQAEWIKLKEILAIVTIDDPTVVVAVEELARLKKIIKFIDETTLALDLELTPLSIWQPCAEQASFCRTAVAEFQSNRNIAPLKRANTHADNLLSYVRPYMIAPRNVQKVLKEAFEAYAKTINEYVASFSSKADLLVKEIENNRTESNLLYGQVKAISTSFEEFEADLAGNGVDDDGIKERITTLVKDLEDKESNINKFYSQLLTEDDENRSIKAEITQAKLSILEDVKVSKAMLVGIKEKIEELEEFHVKIYGKASEGDEEDGLLVDFESRITMLAEFERKQKERYFALNEQINSLLPAATSTGLAAAYGDMKISFSRPIGQMSKLFYVTIGALLCLSIGVTVWESGGQMNLAKPNDWDEVLRGIIYKLPFYIPLVWLAFYASKRRSEFQRLHQEYAHKEALARSYESYKKQLEQLDDENKEMQKALITEAVNAIAYNASVTLDGKHGDKMPVQSMFADIIKRILPGR